MNIPKAIRWLRSIQKYGTGHDPEEETKAFRLGIEALNQIQYFQRMEQPYKGLTLPSETKD